MADNFLYIPKANPVWFIDTSLVSDDAFFTKHLDDYPFEDRLYAWQDPTTFKQLWQTTDIIKLQFESTFDPIIVTLVDAYGTAVITLPALVGLPNRYLSNTYSFEVSMSLAAVPTGCYWIYVTAGTGDDQKVYRSLFKQYISSVPFEEPTLLHTYYHNRFHNDVMYETGIQFQLRVLGHFGFLKPGRSVESYKDQKFNPSVLSSKTFRGFPIVYGDEFGLPDEVIDQLNEIWSCNNVYVDNRSFAAVGDQFEFIEVAEGRYPKRGAVLQVEEGINRSSKIFAQTTDTTKKLTYAINVEAKVFGDLSNQGSSNTVPIITVE